MSLSSIQHQIDSLRRQIQGHNSALATEASREAQKSAQIAQIKRSLSTMKIESTIRSKTSQISRLENEIVAIHRKKADLTKKIADATKKLHEQEARYTKEQDRQQRSLMDALRSDDSRRKADVLGSLRTVGSAIDSMRTDSEPSFDVFICHASEDKDEIVRPLAEALREAGITVWYDEFEIKWGDSLRRAIDNGLVRSKLGIVVISPSFFAKEWPRKELDGLVAKESDGSRVIHPLWHKVTKDDVLKRSPTLADRVALNTSNYTIKEIVERLKHALN